MEVKDSSGSVHDESGSDSDSEWCEMDALVDVEYSDG